MHHACTPLCQAGPMRASGHVCHASCMHATMPGWSDESIKTCGRFYPPWVRTSEQRLEVYSRTFPCVEVDSSTYAIPRPNHTEKWAAKTPAGQILHLTHCLCMPCFGGFGWWCIRGVSPGHAAVCRVQVPFQGVRPLYPSERSSQHAAAGGAHCSGKGRDQSCPSHKGIHMPSSSPPILLDMLCSQSHMHVTSSRCYVMSCTCT
jgi:hypothetical protein